MTSVALAEVATIHAGGRLGLSGNDFQEDGTVPAYGAAGLNGYLNDAEYEGTDAVILSSIGARCGKCFLVRGTWTTLANTQVIVPDPIHVDVRYLWYQLNDEKRWHRSGSAQPFIKPSDVKSHRIYLPSLPEQRRIASILDHADALRAKRRQVVAYLDSLTQSIFNEMFADTEWPLSTLGDVAVVTSGITKGRKTVEPTQPVPYLAVSNVQAGHLRMDVVKEIEATAAEIARYALEDGDLVLTEGGDPDKLGRGTVWRSELPLCLHQNHIFRVRPRRDGAVLSGFLAAYMASRAARSYFLRAAKQTTGIASINMTQLKALPVAMPPVKRQSLYLTRLDRVDAQRVAVQSTIATNDDLFASLQSRAFRGEL